MDECMNGWMYELRERRWKEGMEGYVLDPESGRRLRRFGPKYRKWLRQNYIEIDGKLVFEPSGCLRFAYDPSLNPVTKRSIAERGKTAFNIRRVCSKDGFTCPMWASTKFRINPTTNRRLKRGRPKWKALLRECGSENLCQTWKSVGKPNTVNPLTARRTSLQTIAKLDRQCAGPISNWGQQSKPNQRSRCGNTRTAKTIGYALRVGKSRIPGAGRGLFAVEGFRKGDTITEYEGEVIDIDTALARRRMGLSSHIRSLVPGRLAIDGRRVPPTFGHGGAPFVNDIRDPKKINAKFCNTDKPIKGLKRSGLNVLERSWLRATKDIAPAEEIYVSYGRGFWKK